MALHNTLYLAALLLHGVIAGPLGFGARQGLERSAAVPRRLHGRFLHITDLHPDEFYKLHSSTAEDDACHHGKGAAGTYGAETSDCDSPLALINATFDWIADHLRDEIDFVVWTGDSARHDSDEAIPRSTAQVLGTNRLIADKFVDLFADPVRRDLAIPIVPTLGNNDILPHNILQPGPNKWLQSYADTWRRFIPEEQRHGFEFGGWFYVEVVPNHLAVFSLNTLYFFDRNAAVDDCSQPTEPGFKQMEWLRIQLQFLRDRGMKAILMGHVPPARTDSKQLWQETCWQKYTLWLQQYRDVVVGGLYGHMNIDHFLLQDTKEIDLAMLGDVMEEPPISVREAMEDELSLQSTADYLQELRDGWSKLPKPAVLGGGEEEAEKDKKKKKKKQKLGPFAERYQLSLISPSVVPNYYPTLRVIEYNISGLEDTPVWVDSFARAQLATTGGSEQRVLELRHLTDEDAEESKKKKKDKKKDKKKKKKPSKDPYLVIPDPPSKSSPPGPAYSPQPLTLTGYTQLYANLTHINNDMTPDDTTRPAGRSWSVLPPSALEDWLLRWREGKHGGKAPKAKAPRPRKFEFEVEYSTFDDEVYALDDMTVGSFVELAYRIGKDGTGKNARATVRDGSSAEVEEARHVGDARPEAEEEGEEEDQKDQTEKNKKKDRKPWLHFLRRAFVGTIEMEELEDIA